MSWHSTEKWAACLLVTYYHPTHQHNMATRINRYIHLASSLFTLRSSLTHPLTHSQHWEPCRSPVMPICLPPPFIIVITRAGPFPQFCIKSQLPPNSTRWSVGWLVGGCLGRPLRVNELYNKPDPFFSFFFLSFFLGTGGFVSLRNHSGKR